MARYRAARGTEDLFPDRIPLLEHVFGSCREVFLRHGYGEIFRAAAAIRVALSPKRNCDASPRITRSTRGERSARSR